MSDEEDNKKVRKLLAEMSPEMKDLLAHGLPASIDSDPTEVAGIANLAKEFFAGIEADRARRAAIYWEWRPRRIPNVTLEQGAWLLLGFDPFQSDEPAAWRAAVRERGYRELLNRLECEVAERQLRPIGNRVEGFARRFRFADIARAALEGQFSTDTAQEVLRIVGDKTELAQEQIEHHESKVVSRRLDAHRKYVVSFGSLAVDIPAKSERRLRRKDPGEPVNKRILISSEDYNTGFRAYCREKCPDVPLLDVTEAMLGDDRRDLNIGLKTGRPAQSPGKTAKL